ncbi:MAG: phosphoserine aminotransferase [Myxococcota bacterium]|jgi:phosphoserine aminotransferase
MARIHNFSAGPGVLPEAVLHQAQADLWDHVGSGIGICECSHRSKQFDDVIESAKARIARLLTLDDDQVVLFLHGGARTQFFMLPMNWLRGGRATYLDTGTWSHGAIADARLYGSVDIPFSSRADGYDHVPAPGSLAAPPDATVYLHYTSNNTVAGTEYHHVPDAGNAWLACDMSSNFLSRPTDGSKFGMIYAGAQKNVGPSGATVVIVRRSLLDACDPALPPMLRYRVHADKGSMYNTPATFPIYMIDQVTQWIEDQGGLAAVEAHNLAQSDAVYGVIDGSDFWQGKVQPASRSRMNITFTTGDHERDMRFVSEATAAGMSGLKGHRSVGGLRASVYNAQTDEAVAALLDFMRDFERRNG